jgi:hypothetical protein
MDDPLPANASRPCPRWARIPFCIVLVAIPFVADRFGPSECLWYVLAAFYVGTAILLKSRVVNCAVISLGISLVTGITPSRLARPLLATVVDLVIWFSLLGGFGTFVGHLLDLGSNAMKRRDSGRDRLDPRQAVCSHHQEIGRRVPRFQPVTDSSLRRSRFPHPGWLALLAVVLLLGGGFLSFWIPYQQERRVLRELKSVGIYAHIESTGPGFLNRYFGEEFAQMFTRQVDVQLELSHEVTIEHVQLLGGLPNLSSLAIKAPAPDSQVDVNGSTLQCLVSLPKFWKLDLVNLDISHNGLKSLSRLQRLGSLGLQGSNIDDVGLKQLAPLNRLDFLQLQRTKITDAGLLELRPLANLSVLSIASTAVTDEGLKHLSALASLKYLSLADTQISSRGLIYLKALPRLRILYLGETAVDDSELRRLADLPNLAHLDLSTTRVTDRGLHDLVALTHLRTLNLRTDSVSPAGRTRVRLALPNCEVFPQD